jgi:hypothetical protein
MPVCQTDGSQARALRVSDGDPVLHGTCVPAVISASKTFPIGRRNCMTIRPAIERGAARRSR